MLTGVPRWAGALIGGAIMTVYFTAGGLLGSARVNVLQLVVMMTGFALAIPSVLGGVGGVQAVVGPEAPPGLVISCTRPALDRGGRSSCC